MVKESVIFKHLSMKHLIDSSYLPLETLNKIREDRKLLEFSHILPHWFQRRVLEINQVFNVGIMGWGSKERNSGIYARILMDNTHQVVICVHKYGFCFMDIQVAVRTYKSLKGIMADLKTHSHISIINGMDFRVSLPDAFFSKCPQWTEDEINKVLPVMDRQLNEESKEYCMESNGGHIGIICNRCHVPGSWNITIYPYEKTNEALAFIKAARPRIDNLLVGLKKDFRYHSDVAIGVLPLDGSETILYD